jgi:hypothetical protein
MHTGIQDPGLKRQENGILWAKNTGTKFARYTSG